MSSSSSDSEDENIALLRQAVDTDFINDGMFTSVISPDETASKEPNNASSNSTADSNKSHTALKSLKSQRYIEYNEIETDLNVPKSMQDFVYKKMSKRIAESIEFVDVSSKKHKKSKKIDNNCSVRLLKDTDPITKIDLIPEDLIPIKSEKIEVKRRTIEPDSHDNDAKIKASAIDGESILQQTETKSWKSKKLKPNKMFNYREKKSVLYLIEPANEFSRERKKNNWNESKIANFPWKDHKKTV